MLKLIFKNKKLWLVPLIIIFLVIFMVVLSEYEFNPFGYVIY